MGNLFQKLQVEQRDQALLRMEEQIAENRLALHQLRMILATNHQLREMIDIEYKKPPTEVINARVSYRIEQSYKVLSYCVVVGGAQALEPHRKAINNYVQAHLKDWQNK